MNKKLNVLLADNTLAHENGFRSLLNHYSDYININHVNDGWDLQHVIQTTTCCQRPE